MSNLWVRLRRVWGSRSRLGWTPEVATLIEAGAGAEAAASPPALGRRGCAVEGREVRVAQAGCPFDRIMRVDRVEDVPDRRLVVAELPQRHRHGPVDDLEHPAAGQLLVLDQRDVGLDPSCVT